MPKSGTTQEAAGTLGGRVRAIRAGRGMTLEELSRASGVSRAMISKVERDEKSPTVAVAAKLAAGLGVSVSRLLGGEERRRGVVLPRSRQMVLGDGGSGYERRLLASRSEPGRALELVRERLPGGSAAEPLPPAPVGTVGYVVVERGRVEVRLADEVHTLGEGDALHFEADAGLRVRNPAGGVAVLYRLVLP